MGSGKALKFFCSQCCCDEPPPLHLVLQLKIPVVSYKLVLPSTGAIHWWCPAHPVPTTGQLFPAPTSTRCFLPGCPGHSFPRAQHHSSLCGPGIAVCCPGMLCSGDYARTEQCGAEGLPFDGISHQPRTPSCSCHYLDSAFLEIPVGFYPVFPSAVAGAARQRRGSHRSMQATLPTLHASAAGAAPLLAAVGSLFVFIAWSGVI